MVAVGSTGRATEHRRFRRSFFVLGPGCPPSPPHPLALPLPLQPQFRRLADRCASWSRETLSNVRPRLSHAAAPPGRRGAAVLRNSRRNSNGGFSSRLGRVYRPRETFWKTSGRERSPIHASRLIVGLGTPLNQAGRFLGIPFSP